MPADKIKDVYDLISDKGYFADENEFRSYVSDPKKRKEVYTLIQDDGFFTDEKEFDSYFSDVKKKEPSTTPSSTGYKSALSGIKGTSTPPSEGGIKKSQGVSPSPLKTAGTTTPSVSTKSALEGIKGTSTPPTGVTKIKEDVLPSDGMSFDLQKPQPRLSAEEQQAQAIVQTDIAAQKTQEFKQGVKQKLYNDTRYWRLQDKKEAQERGYAKVEDMYKDRESYLIDNYLDDIDKEEASAKSKYLEAKQSGNEKGMAEYYQQYLKARGAQREKYNANLNELNSQYAEIESQLNDGTIDADFGKTVLDRINQRKANLELTQKGVIDPVKQMDDFIDDNKTEVASVAKSSQTPYEKLREYTNALYTEVLTKRRELGLDEQLGGLEEYAMDYKLRTQNDAGAELDDLYEKEQKLKQATKLLFLNRTSIEDESALGVIGKSFITSLSPAIQGKVATNQTIANNLNSIAQESDVAKNIYKEQQKFADEEAKDYTPYSAKWFAAPIGSSLAIAAEFVPASMLSEGVLGLTKLGRLVNIAEQYGKVKGLNTTAKYLNAVNKYKTAKAADTIGKLVLKTQANGIKFATTSEAVSQLFPSQEDEVNATTGYFGGVIGKGVEQAVGGMAATLFKVFGNKAPQAAKVLSDLGQKMSVLKDAPKTVIGELGEEFGESLGQIYSDSESWKEVKSKLEDQFGTLDKATQFVIQTGIMALGMGSGTSIGSGLFKASKDAYNSLPREERAKVDSVLDSVQQAETEVQDEVANEVKTQLENTNNKEIKKEIEKDEQGAVEEPISAGTDVLEDGVGMAVEPGKEGVEGEDIQTEALPPSPLEGQELEVTPQGQQKEIVSERVSEIEPPVPSQTTTDVGGVTAPNVSESLKSVESTAKALEGVDTKKIGVIDYNAKRLSLEEREKEDKPIIKDNTPIETLAKNSMGDAYELQLVNLDDLNPLETRQSLDLVEKYVDWKRKGNDFPPITAIRKADGTLVIVDGHNRYRAAKLNGDKTIRVWVGLNDGNAPMSIDKAVSQAYHKSKAEGSNPELVAAVEKLLGKPTAEAKPTTKPVAEQIADLRASEQAEYDAMANPKDKAKRKEIYDKYDKLITPLLEEQKAVPVKEAAEVEVVEEEQYEPITVGDTSYDSFTKDNAVDYEEDEKEGDNGRTYTYLSSITVELLDNFSGEVIGTISKLKNEDGDITYRTEDNDGNEIDDNLSTKREAQKSLVDKWNKDKLKEFNKEKAKAAKQKAKEAEKAKAKAEKQAAKETAKPEPKKTKPEQIGEGLLDVLGLAPEEKDVKFSKVSTEKINWSESRIGRGDRAITERNDNVKNAAEDLYQGRIGLDEYNEIVEKNSPIKPITEFIKPAAEKDIRVAVGDKSEGKINLDFPKGKKVGLRLDIPAYINKNIWAITVHEDGKTGSPLSYNNVARIKNVEFTSDPKVALDIARQKELSSGGKMGKATIARMMGEWVPMDGDNGEAKGESAMKMIDEIKNNPEWSQIGMNPFRHSYFYDRATGLPVVAAEEVIQIGGLVYAKNVETTSKNDERFTVKDKNGNPIIGKEGEVVRFSKGKESDKVLLSETEKEQQIIDQMNKMNLVNEGIDLVAPSTTKEEIDVNELNSRLDNPLETVEWTDYEGMPFTFTISDQLRTGDAVNTNTGATINNLKGGIGFNGTKGNENNAWANTTKEEAESMLQRAKDVYANNKPLFDKLWKEGKLPNGHIPMAVVKMAETSILSNEAVFRVGIQNIETLPKANRKNAVSELAKSMQAKIDTESASLKRGVDKNGKPYTENTVKLKKKAINQYQKILDSINKNKYDDIVDVLKDKDNFSLPEKSLIANEVFYGSPTPIGGKEIDISRSRPSTPVSKALLGNANPSLINLGKITDLLTEPSMKNVPNMHVVSIVGVDIKATEVNKINHPNYPYGVKGVSIGVLKNPVHMKDAFGEAYGSALGQVVKNEAANASVSIKSALTQGIPVQSGLPNRVFKSAIAKGELDSVDKLAGFLRQAFPNTTFFTSNEAWDAAMADPSIKKKLKDGDVVYAFTTDGNVFINPSLKTTKATLHETGHIWMGFVKENNPALHAKGLDLVTGTKEHQKAIQEYGDTELAREEALMELMSSKGDTIVNASQKAKFKEWLLSVYKYIADNFTSLLGLSPKEIENLTLDKFLEGMLADVLSGKELTTKKIKGEVKFSRESQNSKIKDYIESQRKAGESDKDIRAGIESVADKLGLTASDINDLMSVTVEEVKPSKGYTPKQKVRRMAARIMYQGKQVPDSLVYYTPTEIEDADAKAKQLFDELGLDNTVNLIYENPEWLDNDFIPRVAKVTVEEISKEQEEIVVKLKNTEDKNLSKRLEKLSDMKNMIYGKILPLSSKAGLSLAMYKGFFDGIPFDHVREVQRLLEVSNEKTKNTFIDVLNKLNLANGKAIVQVAEKVASTVGKSKVEKARANYESSKRALKDVWNRSKNVGIAETPWDRARKNLQFDKALAKAAKDFVIYKSVQFSQFIKEVSDMLGIAESDIDKDHLKGIFDAVKEKEIQKGIKGTLSDMDMSLKDLIVEHFTELQETEKTLVDKLKESFGLEQADAQEVANEVSKELRKLSSKEKLKAIKASGLTQGKWVDELLTLSDNGSLEYKDIRDAFAKKIGLRELTDEEVKKLETLATKLRAEKDPRKRASLAQDLEDYKHVLKARYNILDFLVSDYLSNLFASLGSNEVNFLGNFMESLFLLNEIFAKSIIKGNFKDLPMALNQFAKGAVRGAGFAKQVITEGKATYKPIDEIKPRGMFELIMMRPDADLTNFEKFYYFLSKNLGLKKGFDFNYKFWNRLLLSMDAFSGIKNNELAALYYAIENANKLGLNGQERADFINKELGLTISVLKNALKVAKELGYEKGSKEYDRLIQDLIIESRSEELKEFSKNYSKRSTLTQEPPAYTLVGAIASGINSMSKNNKATKFIFPVVNTFANLIIKGIERSPFEFVSLGADAMRLKTGNLTQEQLPDEEIKRRLKAATIATVAGVALFLMAGGADDEDKDFDIYGSGTGDKDLDASLRATGWKPYSIRFTKGGGYWSFEYTPIGFLLGFVGDMRDLARYKSEEHARLKQMISKDIYKKNYDELDENEKLDVFNEAMSGQYKLDDGFLTKVLKLALTPVKLTGELIKSVGAISKIMGGDVDEGVKYFASTGRGILSPRYGGEIKDIFDNKTYDSKLAWTVLTSNVPFIEVGNVKLDGFGRDITKYDREEGGRGILQGLKYAVTRRIYNPSRGNEVDFFLAKNMIKVLPPSNDLRYTDEKYREYQVLRGSIAMDYIKRDLEEGKFDDLSPMSVKDKIDEILGIANRKAKKQINETLTRNIKVK